MSTRLVTLAAVVIPFAGLIAALLLLWGWAFDGIHLALLGGMYALTILGIGVGYHRLFTHRSFETGAVLRFLWGVLGSMAVQGSILKWVAVHRKHHRHADDPDDPHSPHRTSAGGVRAMLRGFWHAHVGWMFDKDGPELGRYVPDLGRDRVVRFLSATFPLWVVVGLSIPAVLGGILTMSWRGALLGLLWGGLARIFLVHHVTWSVNSVCHLWGLRRFETGDESRDNPVFGLLAFGEGWHNTHHAFPASARHGLAWWQLDVSWLVIRGMELVGLARNVRRPSRRLVAMRRRN